MLSFYFHIACCGFIVLMLNFCVVEGCCVYVTRFTPHWDIGQDFQSSCLFWAPPFLRVQTWEIWEQGALKGVQSTHLLKLSCLSGVSILHKKNERRNKECNKNPCSLFVISVSDLWFAELRWADLGTAVLEPGTRYPAVVQAKGSKAEQCNSTLTLHFFSVTS